MRAYLQQQVHKPLDIRSKTTRALRRKLSPADASKLTVKGKKKATHFPVRKFAVKA
jgi:large subunit ribosomal protein L35e